LALFRPTQLFRPTSVEDAVKILKENEGRARVVAGNTMLYDLAQHGGLDDVQILVDISRIGLNYIILDGIELKIGALTTFSEIANFSLNPKGGVDALFETAAKITPPQIRNSGTIGGALCSGIPFLDMPTTVLALNGEIHSVASNEKLCVSAKDFFVDYFQTAIRPDELLTSVHFRLSEPGAGSSFVKLGRVSVDFAVVNTATYIQVDEIGRCSEARIALGAVASTPIRWTSAEQKIIGKKLDRNTIIKALDNAKLDFDPLPTIGAPSDYKRLVIPVLVRDSLMKSLSRATKQNATWS
jgi:carbon-monoxide dehydrogenase medium subunit